MTCIKIMTINVKSIRTDYKWYQLLTFLEENSPDICFIQETNITETYRRSIPNYRLYINPATIDYSGTAIAVKNVLAYDAIQHDILVTSYLQKLTIKFEHTVNNRSIQTIWHFFCTYISHSDDIAKKTLELLEDNLVMLTLEQCRIVVGGDFNCTLNPEIDRCNSKERNLELSKKLANIVQQFTLYDCWRLYNPEKGGYTFVSNTKPKSASRIDRIYITENMVSNLSSARLHTSFSDHVALSVGVKQATNQYFCTPYWKFNNDLLNDEDFIESMKIFLNNEINMIPPEANLLREWEKLKINIKDTVILYNRQRRQAKNAEIKLLNENLNKTIEQTSQNPQLLDNVSSILKASSRAYKYSSDKQAINRNYEQLLQTDRPEIFRSHNYRPLSKLRHGGQVITNPTDLCSLARAHFEERFTSDGLHLNKDSILFKNLRKLPDTSTRILNVPFSLNDLTEALSSLNKKKAPGIDGLTTEFFIQFWELLGPLYHSVFVTALHQKTLPKSSRKAVIGLIPKKGDLLSIDNWRPISLLTTDYKIIAKTLSTRISAVLPSLIKNDQSYSVPGRTIYDNLHLHRDIIHYTNENDLPLAILNLDQQAAFDRVNHEYLFHILELYNLGDHIIDSIRTLYQNATFHVRIGSLLTGELKFCKGIRQGCPLSGTLFSLAIEPFLNLCRQYLDGVSLPIIPAQKLVTSAYADDVSVFITNNLDFKLFEEIYAIYAKQSGSILNRDKSSGFWAGSWKGREDTPLSFKWTSQNIKVLGITFSHDIQNDTEFAFKNLITKLSSCFQKWKNCAPELSLLGKRMVVNQFIAPKLWYPMQVLPFNEDQVNFLQRMIVEYMWNGKHWTSQKDLCIPQNQGGLGLVHLPSKVQLFRCWLGYRLLGSSGDATWAVVMKELLIKSNPYRASWQCLFLENKHTSVQNYPGFLRSLLRTWDIMDLRITDFPKTIQEVKSIPSTSSRLLPKTTKPPLFSTRWVHLGFKTMSDFFCGNSWLSTEELAAQLQQVSSSIRNDLICHFYTIQNYFTQYCTYEDTGNQSIAEEKIHKVFLHDQDDRIEVKDNNKKKIQTYLTCTFFDQKEPLNGHWEEQVNWKAYFVKPNLGHDSIVAWRLAKDRLADPVFLHRAGLRDSSQCPWCTSVGDSWHIIFTCFKNQDIWELVKRLVKTLLNCERISFVDIYKGFKSRSCAGNLANYLTTLGKSTVYNAIVSYLKGERRTICSYKHLFVARLKSRIFKEFSWHLNRDSITEFEEIWCYQNVLCFVADRCLYFSDQLVL